MSIKILLLKSNEEIITEAKEIANPDSTTAIGYHLHKPFRLEIVSDEGELVFNREKGYQLSWFPWAPLSKDKDFFLPADHVILYLIQILRCRRIERCRSRWSPYH